jgi:putative FmdB family regulatory protein
MPVYSFQCPDCGAERDLLRKLGDTTPPDCEACGGPTRHRLSRVAVRYNSWGFTATDKLVGDTRGKDYRALRDKATEISDS